MTKLIASNPKALRDYKILEIIECGIALTGGEVKSMREGKVNFKDSFARLENHEVILYNTHISPYAQASYLNADPIRPRKLLLHKTEIVKLAGQVAQKGLTLVPVKAYFGERGFVKIELALCRGKKLYDRREDIKLRQVDLELRRIMKARRK